MNNEKWTIDNYLYLKVEDSAKVKINLEINVKLYLFFI